MTETSPADRRWNPWTIWVPAAIAFGQATLLGTAGAFGAGFGLGSSCTDDFDCTGSCPPCTALYDWLKAGAVGQWVLATAAVMLLVLGLARPAHRRTTAIGAWAIIVLAAVWFYVTTQLGRSSF
jgi:hypothetical protein